MQISTSGSEDMGSDKEIYEKAKKRIKSSPEKARLLFKEVMHLYPDSIYARRAKIGIADSYYRQKYAAAMIMAARKTFLRKRVFSKTPPEGQVLIEPSSYIVNLVSD